MSWALKNITGLKYVWIINLLVSARPNFIIIIGKLNKYPKESLDYWVGLGMEKQNLSPIKLVETQTNALSNVENYIYNYGNYHMYLILSFHIMNHRMIRYHVSNHVHDPIKRIKFSPNILHTQVIMN